MTRFYPVERLEPGDVIQVWEDDRHAYRVVEVKERPDDLDGKWAMIVEPTDGGKRVHLLAPERATVYQRLGEHHQICAACGDVWPCQHVVDEREVERFRRTLERLCDHCGDVVGNSQWYVKDGDRIWHLAKRNGCRQGAVDALGKVKVANQLARYQPPEIRKFVPDERWDLA